jgi:hypothetical protein
MQRIGGSDMMWTTFTLLLMPRNLRVPNVFILGGQDGEIKYVIII